MKTYKPISDREVARRLGVRSIHTAYYYLQTIQEIYDAGLIICERLSIDEPKRGEWIQTSNDWIDGTCGTRYYPIHCSICNYSTYDDSATNFCPNCGAKMKGNRLCQMCDDYAGDGMYCAKNHLVYDFSLAKDNCENESN